MLISDKKTLELPIKTSDSMNVLNTNGDISVLPWEGTTLQVEIQLKVRSITRDSAVTLLKNIEIKAESNEGKIMIRSCLPQSITAESNISVNFKVKAPRGWFGGLDAVTINGNIAVSSFAGSLGLLTTNGNLNINDWTGKGRAETTNGNISGKNLSNSGYFELNTTNGNIAVRMARRPEAEIKLSTTNGNATLEMPKESKVNFELQVDNGNIKVSGFADTNKLSSKDNLCSSANGGGPTIFATICNGNIGVSG